ncbi:MAG: methyl-accepting chemotaxis protein, partial [Rhodocyclaceae bacterium]|nr:methyl-accepting chemotaxis protein [Rhodocyclaceae bacterium]
YTGVYDRLRHITLACFVVIGVLLTVLITALLGARLRPLQAVMQGLDAFGRGNLRTRIQVAEGSDNEIDRLALAVNRSAHSMGALVGSIRQTSSQVRDCAEDMNTSAEQLHGAVRTLSESACEMSANSQQLSSSIQQVSSSASSADELATQAVSEVNTGKQVTLEVIGFARNIEERVRSSLAEVERLNTMSQEINHALVAIRSVAEQTNLLALNAAIEAARAGEAGRGFAVVADEVRKLAGQSEQSTGEISNILNRVNSGIQSVQQTISGAAQEAVQSTEAAGRAEGALNSIEQITGEIAHAINAIAHSVQEQSKATSNVVQRLEHAAQITEEAGKTSANVAHSAEDLGHAAASLEENVGHFQT